MKGGSKLFIIAGVGLAAIAILLAVVSMKGGEKADAQNDTKSSKVKVVRAKVDVPAHHIFAITDIEQVEVNSGDAPQGAAASINEVIGQASLVPLVIGQPVLTAQIETPGLRNDIAAGKRAIALPVNETSAMAGLVQDGDYVDLIFHGRINVIRLLPTTAVEVPEDKVYSIKSPAIIPPDLEQPNHPAAGDPGSKFYIRDEVGDQSELEPVAKIMLQDIRILRVVRPGDTFLGNGAKDEAAAAEEQSGGISVSSEPQGQFILEVTPEQAEMITFMQDKHHEYQVIVRGKDDHETVTTSGITFEILATEEDWALPWPKSLTAPKEQRTPATAGGDSEGGADSESESDSTADS